MASFAYLIPDDNEVFDVTVRGTWGYPILVESSAPAEVFVEGVLVATCEKGAACWDELDGTLVDWSFSFREAHIPDFESLFRDGVAELSVRQLGRHVVGLHDLSLTVLTRPAGSDTSD